MLIIIILDSLIGVSTIQTHQKIRQRQIIEFLFILFYVNLITIHYCNNNSDKISHREFDKQFDQEKIEKIEEFEEFDEKFDEFDEKLDEFDEKFDEFDEKFDEFLDEELE